MYVVHDNSSLAFLFAVGRPQYNYTMEDFHYHSAKAYWDPRTIRGFLFNNKKGAVALRINTTIYCLDF